MKLLFSLLLISGVILVLNVERSEAIIKFIDKALCGFERAVRKGIVKPVEKLGQNLIERPIRKLLEEVGLKKVRVHERYEDIKYKAVRLIKTPAKSWHTEPVIPCADGKHNMMKSEEPTIVEFDGNKYVYQDSYCTKCGMHVLSEHTHDEF